VEILGIVGWHETEIKVSGPAYGGEDEFPLNFEGPRMQLRPEKIHMGGEDFAQGHGQGEEAEEKAAAILASLQKEAEIIEGNEQKRAEDDEIGAIGVLIGPFQELLISLLLAGRFFFPVL